MISVKGGTKTWSDSKQQVDYKSDGKTQMSSQEQQEIFGGEDVGAVLNKISDPNYIDPSKKVRQVGKNELDKDAFLNLLLTQMKNQDPTNPLKSHEMAAQLAQFTSLEKLTAIDQGIEKLGRAQEPQANFDALNFIGRVVSVDTAQISRTRTEDTHELKFELKSEAPKAKLHIKDVDGEIVRTLNVASLKSGKNEVHWNGTLEDGRPAPPGEYTLEVEAVGTNGAKLAANTKTEGKITGVNFTSAGPVLLVGQQQILMKDVSKIVDPGVGEIRAESHQIPVLQNESSGNGNAPITAPSKPAANAPKTSSKSNLGEIAMSQGMINDLQKQGAKAGM